MSDASDFGWSGVILPYFIRDIWSGLDQYRSINERELLALTFFVHFMQSFLAGKHVVSHTDSEVVFFCLKRGLSSLTSSNGPGQAKKIIFRHESCHSFRGPTYSRYAKCPCGHRAEGQTQCFRQLPGPKNFVILFQSGTPSGKCSGSLF